MVVSCSQGGAGWSVEAQPGRGGMAPSGTWGHQGPGTVLEGMLRSAKKAQLFARLASRRRRDRASSQSSGQWQGKEREERPLGRLFYATPLGWDACRRLMGHDCHPDRWIMPCRWLHWLFGRSACDGRRLTAGGWPGSVLLCPPSRRSSHTAGERPFFCQGAVVSPCPLVPSTHQTHTIIQQPTGTAPSWLLWRAACRAVVVAAAGSRVGIRRRRRADSRCHRVIAPATDQHDAGARAALDGRAGCAEPGHQPRGCVHMLNG